MASSIALRLITVAVTAAAVGLLSWMLRNAKPNASGESVGMIVPEKFSAYFTVFIGSGMALFGIAGTLFGQASWAGVGLTLLGLAIGGFMAPSLTSIHRVRWTQDGIEGPSKIFGPSLGVARTTIAWGDIVRAGTTITSYWFVEAQDGRRVYWSYLYKGYGALTSYLRDKRPNLTLPANMG